MTENVCKCKLWLYYNLDLCIAIEKIINYMCDLIVFRIDFLIIGINQFLIHTQLHLFADRNGSHCL